MYIKIHIKNKNTFFTKFILPNISVLRNIILSLFSYYHCKAQELQKLSGRCKYNRKYVGGGQ